MNECPICKAPAIQHSPNQLMECSLKKEIAALQRQLEPSPCGCRGIGMRTSKSISLTKVGPTTVKPASVTAAASRRYGGRQHEMQL